MGDTSEMWKPPFPPGWNHYVNQLDPRVGRIEEICQAVVGELRKQGLTDSPGCISGSAYVGDHETDSGSGAEKVM